MRWREDVRGLARRFPARSPHCSSSDEIGGSTLRYLSGGRLQRGSWPFTICDHPREFFLHELMRGDGLVAIACAFLHIAARCRSTPWRRPAHPSRCRNAPDSGSERAFEPGDRGKHIFFGNFAIAERQAGSDGSAQRPFSVDVPGLKSWSAFSTRKP